MPIKVDESQVPARTRRGRYDFESTADGDWYKWEQGKDFEGKSLTGTARAWARRAGFRVETRTASEGKEVYLRFVKAS